MAVCKRESHLERRCTVDEMAVQRMNSFGARTDLKVSHLICLRRLCYGVLFLASFVAFDLAFLGYGIWPSTWMLPTSKPLGENVMMDSTAPLEESIQIEDVIAYYSGEALVLVRIPAALTCPPKEKLLCRFGDISRFAFTKPTAFHMIRGDRAAVLCASPPKDLSWDESSFRLIEMDQVQEIRQGGISPPQRPLIQWSHRDPGRAAQLWSPTNLVVYEAFSTEHDVVVLVHGASSPFDSLSDEAELARIRGFRCVFDGGIETKVTSQALEVFRCPHPPAAQIPSLAGKRVTVKINRSRPATSVAFYSPWERVGSPTSTTRAKRDRHQVCSCIMLNNRAKFLSEWMHYYRHLGVSKLFLYDNNSEDNLEETIASLTARGFNISKQGWPWVKTQNAAFSHCSLLASAECEWATFIDIDEYLFPNLKFLPPRNVSGTPLAEFITATKGSNKTNPVGQLWFFCYDFGPSGLTVSPPQGVTQGYTCRMKRVQRHKSIVLLRAVHESLRSSIHHFRLRDEYTSQKITQGVGAINHYKYQVWSEFQIKFRRRASTYVVDWTMYRTNETSLDRAPDLGNRAVKPADWEERYCEVWDDRLRNYTRSTFGSYDREASFRLAWEKVTLR